jgi:rhodanese-related sulfurtransferase/membrane protein insertase Oxa1/YidC/SpoIIIJ/phosphohistidine swiveling domain-containing protein
MRGASVAANAGAAGLRCVSVRLVVAVALCLVGTGSAFAIPSPELIVGSFTSISQLFALGSALLGGGAAVATMRMRTRGAQTRTSLAVLLGALVVLVASLGLNVYQYLSQSADRQARLEATLTRPMPNLGGKSLDPDLKEASYDEQLRHPRGISTEDAEKLLAETLRGQHPDVVFLDIRESAEAEMGSLPGAVRVRFPDIVSSKLDLAHKKPIVFCHNGNRGFETCAKLAAMGIDCRFLVGGLEKWLVEQRSLTGLDARTLDDLRALPSYRNQTVLLDTSEVHKLVDEQGAVFVDVRYPGEFASGALPGAINLPIRPTPTEALKTRIAQLPHQPIVVPCYDRRSCFFAEVLGLELTRAGYDYRGKYTLPWEYFTASKPRPYIQEWLEQAHKSWWTKASEHLADAIVRLGGWIGIVPAILLLAILSRLLVLPFSVKAERDQIKSRAVADELAALKQRLAGDGPRLTRAIGRFYQRHGLTPMRNLIALLFLPIMALALTAVQRAVSTDSEPLGWIVDLSERDRWFVLPIAFAGLITLYIDMAFVRSRTQRIGLWAAVFPLFIATGALFSAGTDVYLVMSAALLIVQRLCVNGVPARLALAWRRRRLGADIVSLDDPARLAGHGNKALRLGRMRAAGVPVPAGVLLIPAFLADFAAASAAERKARLDQLWRELGSGRVVVRSSANGEDNAAHSFAGVFESVLDVDRDGLEAAIGKVEASFKAARVAAYGATGGTGSILVQRMIEAEFAGVLFTRDPSAAGLTMIEMVKGTAENLVSGTVRPWAFRFGRVSGRQFGEGAAPIDLAPLLALGRRVEDLFGRSQDIEWTYADGRFHLVQSRDVTRVMAGEPDHELLQEDLARALDAARGAAPDEVVFAKNELSEMLPRPTALSLSLMRTLWASGGSVERAARKLGFSYPVGEDSTLLTTILGRLYVDKREEQARGFSIGPIAARSLLRRADRIERAFRDDFLPRFLAEVRLLEAADFDRLGVSELVEEIGHLHAHFTGDTHVEVDTINIAANFYLETARRVLTEAGLEPSSVLGHIPETVESRAISEAATAPAESRQWFMARSVGHRAAFDYELAEPRYAENGEALIGLIVAKGAIAHQVTQDNNGLSPRQSALIDVARRFQTLKEDAKHHSLRELAALRRALLALDRQLGLGGLVFHLTFDEIATIGGRDPETLHALAVRRLQDAARLSRTASLPAMLTVAAMEAASCGETAAAPQQDGAVRGTRVSGGRSIEGRAYVVSEGDAERGTISGDFHDGDIIVAPMINPNWLPYFSRAGGFVSEVGGWLSHTAILAREHDVPMIVGTQGISRIPHGSLLRLHLDGQVEIIAVQKRLGKTAAA